MSKLRNRENNLAKARIYYARNKDRQAEYYRQKYIRERESILAKCRAWYGANREKAYAQTRAYRARQLNAAVGSDRAAYAAFCKLVKGIARIACHWCGKNAPKGKRHIDHIIPLVRGGPDDVYNLCCSCAACNLSKATRPAEQFTGQYELAFV